MDMIDLNLEQVDVKVCPDDLVAEKDLMDAQTLIVEEDCSLGSVEDQNVSDLSSPETLLDSTSTNADDVQYQFRSNDGVTYRVVQVNSSISPDSDSSSSLPQIISSNSSLTNTQQLQTVFTNPLSGQLYVIGSADEVYPKVTNHKPIAPRTGSVVEQVRSPGISRDDRRRATHNEVERRRRDKINNWILKLSKMVPSCHTDCSKGFDAQPSKGGILAKACDYISELSDSNQKLMHVLKENERLIAEIAKQKTMNEQLFRENTELRDVLEENGLTIDSSLESELER